MHPDRAKEAPAGFGLAVLLTLWIVILFDPQWYLAARGVTVALRAPTLLFGVLLLVLAVGAPMTPSWARRWHWNLPFLAFIGTGTVTLPWALNNGFAREAVQVYLLYWALAVATICMVDSVRRAERLLLLYGMQFLWWGAWGATSGLVSWQIHYANYDGFGAFAVGGIGISYFMALATPPGWLRRSFYVAAALCTIGVVASHARGAFLAAATLFLVIWLRSPRKGATLVTGIAGGVMVVVAAELLFEEGFFWSEIMSAFEEGTTEGTGSDRMELWGAAWQVFMDRPVFGTGPRNWGVYASLTMNPGDIGGMYAANIGALYDRSLHSLYFSILSEQGIAGMAALIWVLVDFWKRNAVLRTPEASNRWRRLGGRLSLRPIALGLEACMVAFLVTASLYALQWMHWFYTLLALNLLLHSLVTHGGWARSGKGRGAPARGLGRRPRGLPRPVPGPIVLGRGNV